MQKLKIEFQSSSSLIGEAPILSEVKKIVAGAWLSASDSFEASNDARKEHKKPPKVGKQAYLNKELESRFCDGGWQGLNGRFFKENTWIRFSFRHSMSLGSDFLEAFRVYKLEQFQTVCLMYADEELLREIWPSGGQALCSFEKANAYWAQLHTVIDMPLAIARLHN